ncbi:mammalian ependymin-related protein 1-like [Haliotis rubra]|uniref:mammalian ependymin-related protein 1-like n=1 Tax=Haliotis rubra TaxID=36100 RepID=UPI001EE4EEEF|nr:mammalian ependymin-related protein 1-like [Haliotis rubra]
MMKIALFALFVALTAAGPVADPCCTPDQWEGIAGSIVGSVTNGKSTSAQSTTLMSYDFTDMMLASDTTTMVDGMTFKNKTIIDYNKKLMYNFNEMSGVCDVMEFDQPFQKACVPDNAKELGNFYYGAGDNMLQATSYMIQQDPFTAYVSMTTTGCIPITEIAYGDLGTTAVMTTTGFVNITPGIKDKSVFTPPSACAQAKVQDAKKSTTRGMLGLHV